MDVISAPVRFNRAETPTVWRLGLEYDAFARDARSARFLMLAIDDAPGAPGTTGETLRHLIPRPFSISDVSKAEDGAVITEILYKPIGRVTGMMTGLRPGDELKIGGLLGNGFPLPSDGRRPVLLAGGIGNAPFAYQVRELLDGPEKADPSRVVLFLAGRSSEDVWIQESARDAGITIVEVTDDGSRGERGLVTEALSKRLPDLGPIEAFACGPEPMLHAVAEMALEHDFPCWLSVEERMACGYGVCNACVVEERCDDVPRGEGWFIKSCVEGPVFEAREIHA